MCHRPLTLFHYFTSFLQQNTCQTSQFQRSKQIQRITFNQLQIFDLGKDYRFSVMTTFSVEDELSKWVNSGSIKMSQICRKHRVLTFTPRCFGQPATFKDIYALFLCQPKVYIAQLSSASNVASDTQLQSIYTQWMWQWSISQHFTTSDDVFINGADAAKRECVAIEQDLTYVLKWKLKKNVCMYRVAKELLFIAEYCFRVKISTLHVG